VGVGGLGGFFRLSFLFSFCQCGMVDVIKRKRDIKKTGICTSVLV